MLVYGFLVILFLASIFAGIFGSIVGLGGGVIIVPVLTLLLGVDIHFAIGASIARARARRRTHCISSCAGR